MSSSRSLRSLSDLGHMSSHVPTMGPRCGSVSCSSVRQSCLPSSISNDASSSFNSGFSGQTVVEAGVPTLAEVWLVSLCKVFLNRAARASRTAGESSGSSVCCAAPVGFNCMGFCVRSMLNVCACAVKFLCSVSFGGSLVLAVSAMATPESFIGNSGVGLDGSVSLPCPCPFRGLRTIPDPFHFSRFGGDSPRSIISPSSFSCLLERFRMPRFARRSSLSSVSIACPSLHCVFSLEGPPRPLPR
mmetsp:Transcript_9807/g.59703  ORF Transcript_9807/g.59703 Transcript_9807/m.59703 type:complete len:244 (-) Transcript_9807:297-1028(-)